MDQIIAAAARLVQNIDLVRDDIRPWMSDHIVYTHPAPAHRASRFEIRPTDDGEYLLVRVTDQRVSLTTWYETRAESN